MKRSITQEKPYGCGIDCFAFVANITHKEAEEFLGEEHYLVFHNGKWMDPYINLHEDHMFGNPTSGYREVLPGQAMYALTPA